MPTSPAKDLTQESQSQNITEYIICITISHEKRKFQKISQHIMLMPTPPEKISHKKTQSEEYLKTEYDDLIFSWGKSA